MRVYGENAHHDVTWLASDTGTVSQALRYDPWGNPRATVPTGYTPFRFQGSYYDATTDLSWVVTRWYAPTLGRFVSEDTLLGDANDPESRHLLAYAQGEPVASWDADGQAVITDGGGGCGGYGCVASPSGPNRIRQWQAFFNRFPGEARDRNRPKGAPGAWGGAMVNFLSWVVKTGGYAGSMWWREVDRIGEVQPSLTAWKEFDRHHTGEPFRTTRATAGAKKWWKYVTYKSGVPLDYHGGTGEQAWSAHQVGLWEGVAAARKYRGWQPRAEQLVMFKVLANVEFYNLTGRLQDNLLGIATIIADIRRTRPAAQRLVRWLDMSGVPVHERRLRGTGTKPDSATTRAPGLKNQPDPYVISEGPVPGLSTRFSASEGVNNPPRRTRLGKATPASRLAMTKSKIWRGIELKVTFRPDWS